MIKNNPAKIDGLYLKRDIESKLTKYLKTKEIIALIGPRQVGKSTVLNKLHKDISKKKKSVFLTFEDKKILNFFQEDVESFKKTYIDPNEIIFIDEIQYAKDAGQKLKYIYDTTGKKIVISGSSSLEIRDMGKFLVGRIFTFYLNPLSFSEFLSYRDTTIHSLYQNSSKENEISKSSEIKKVTLKLFEEYLIYGGYPRVVLAKTNEEKEFALGSVIDNYLLKEIRSLLKLATEDELLRLTQLLSLQTGNLISYNELSLLTGFSRVELKKHLNILKETYILDLIKPYFRNRRVELVKNPKAYFIDTGMRNKIIDNFSKVGQRTDIGQIAENYVFDVLRRNFPFPKKINFWRTKSQAEVDF
ncbi:ATP-binding protein, partial [Candidatus Microgenomates bacterium]|nr:ATP-binding protein [Candidatus Microgenomates bacterium]